MTETTDLNKNPIKLQDNYTKAMYDNIAALNKLSEEIAKSSDKYKQATAEKVYKDVLSNMKKQTDSFGRTWRNILFGSHNPKNLMKNLFKGFEQKQTLEFFRKKGFDEKAARKAAKNLFIETGRGTGVIADLTAALGKVVAGFGVFVGVLQAASAVLKTVGERNKYYRAAITYSPDEQASMYNSATLFKRSTEILQATRDPFRLGIFTGNENFINAFRKTIDSGTLKQSNIYELLDSFKYIASQGVLLGNTFEETAQNISQISSTYNLGIDSGNSIENFKYISRAIEKGMQAGLTSTNVMSFFTQYNKQTAVSNTGFVTAIKDFLITLDTIKHTNGQQRQQYLTALQGLSSNKMPFNTYLGLVSRQQYYSKGALNNQVGRYWEASALQSSVQAFNYLKSRTGMGTDLTLQLGSQLGLFQGLDNAIGHKIMTELSSNKGLLAQFNALKDKSAANQAKWLTEKLGLSDAQRVSIEKSAQLSELLSDPMKAIVNILQAMLRYIATMAASPLLNWGGKAISFDEAFNNLDSRSGNILNRTNTEVS